MKSFRVINTTAALFLVGSIAAGTAQAQGRGDPRHPEQQQQAQGDPRHPDKDQKHGVSQKEQEQRIEDQRRRDTEYQQALNNQMRVAQQQAAALQAQRRASQYAAQQQYLANLRQQQERLRGSRDYARDPYFATAPTLRYRVSGQYHETNQYGAEVLRQAVNYGYQQGFQAGRADRQDRWQSNYSKSYAYQDANYGYNGQYVPQSDYNFYFREGFRRGYEDGYGTRAQYGTISNGSPSILANILSGILGLTSIH